MHCSLIFTLQWSVYIDGRHQGLFLVDKNETSETDESTTLKNDDSAVTVTITNVCNIYEIKPTYVNLTLAHFQIANVENKSSIINCTTQLSEKLYYSAAEITETGELCKDQYVVIYVNESADYLDLKLLCNKVQGTILTLNDLKMYNEDIKSIKSSCQTDGIQTWIFTDNNHDFNSWCTVVLLDGKLETRPCHEKLSCNICKIKAALQVFFFGELEEFDRNFTVRTTNKGELYLQGHENSFVSEVNDNWIISSSMISFKCYNNETALPFVRLNWTCGEKQKLLTFSLCTLDEFACDSGGCRPENKRCDGVVDCDDGSDEQKCKHIRKDPGYDVKQFPPKPDGNNTWHFLYRFVIFSIADIKTSDFYADVDLAMTFEWRDIRLELWDPPKSTEVIDCSEIWHANFIAIDSDAGGHLIKLPEDRKTKCSVKVANLNSLEKMYKDPYMGT